MRDVHELLRASDGGPPSEPDLDAIGGRARRLSHRRTVTTWAACLALLAIVAGAAQLATTGAPPAPFVTEVDESTEGNDPAEEATPTEITWMTSAERDAWVAEHGDTTWIVGYFFDAAGFASVDPADGLTVRWWRIDDEVESHGPAKELAYALEAMTAPAPEGLIGLWEGQGVSQWEGQGLELLTAELEGDELVLDFAVLDVGSAETTRGTAMYAQLHAVATHYFPEAQTLCVLVQGESIDWLHDQISCPSRELR